MNVKNVETFRDYLCQIRVDFACYVCGKVLSNPRTVRCGHSYCKHCIYKLLYLKRSCPRCVTYPVTHYNVEKNDVLYKLITQFKKLEVAFEADTNFSLSQDLFHRSHIAYVLDNLEHRRSTTSLQAQNSFELSEILQPSDTRTDASMVKTRNMTKNVGKATANTIPKNVPDRESSSETEYFRRYQNVNNRKNRIASDLSLEEEHESDLNSSVEDFADEEEDGEKEQTSVFSNTSTHSSLESDDRLQNEEEEAEKEHNLSEEESRGHPSHESDLDRSVEDFTREEKEEEGEKEQNSAFSDTSKLSSLESDEDQEVVRDESKIDLTEESLSSLKSISSEIELPLNIEPHTEDVSIIYLKSFQLSDSEGYKSKRFDRFAESENMVSQSNRETEALEESVIPLESYRKVFQRRRNKKSTITAENPSNLIETIESLPIVHTANLNHILLNKSPVNKFTPNFSRRINNNVRFIKLGRLNKIKNKVPFYYCWKLSSRYNPLIKDSGTLLSTNLMRTNLPKKSPVYRTYSGFQTSGENFSPETSQVEENSHREKKKSPKKRKLSAKSSNSELDNYSDETELLDDYIKKMKYMDKEKLELGTSRKRKFANTEFVNRIENSETREIERIRDYVQEANICESFQVEKLFSFDKESENSFNISE